MTDYTWPSAIIPNSSSWRLIANTAAFSSPITGVTRTLGRGGDRWACTLTCNNLHGTNRALMLSYIAKLRGQSNRATISDHAYTKRGTQAANILVNGASQTGSSLITDGGTISATLLEGDMITVGGYLYMVTTDATFNGSGQATLAISPPLHSSPANDAAVTVVSPTGRFILANNTVGWSNSPGGTLGAISSFTLEFVEDLIP